MGHSQSRFGLISLGETLTTDVILKIMLYESKQERRKEKYFLFYHIVNWEKTAPTRDLNPQPLDHEVCTLPLCYIHCPIV